MLSDEPLEEKWLKHDASRQTTTGDAGVTFARSDTSSKNNLTQQQSLAETHQRKEKAEDDTEESSSGDDDLNNMDVPLFKYARLVGSLPRRSAQDSTVSGSNNYFSDPCTCSAMACVVLPPPFDNYGGLSSSKSDGMDLNSNSMDSAAAAAENTAALVQPPFYNIIAMGFETGKVYVTDATTGISVVTEQLIVHNIVSKEAPIVDLSFDASGTHLAAVNQMGLVAIWDFKFQTVAPNPLQRDRGGSLLSTAVAALSTCSIQASRMPYPASFGPPTCLKLDPAYKKRREKAVLVGFADGRLVLTKRSFIMFGRRTDSVIYQSPTTKSGVGGIEALAWRGSLISWADFSGIKLFDVESMARIAHVDRPSGARLSLYPTLSSLSPSLLFETSESFLIGWGDCVMAMTIKGTNNGGGAVVEDTAAVMSGGDAAAAAAATKSLRKVECTMAWELDCVACGVVPLDKDHLIVLGLCVPDEASRDQRDSDDNDDDNVEPGRVSLVSPTLQHPNNENDLEVHVISRSQGTIVHCDSLALLKSHRDATKLGESASGTAIMSSFALPRMNDAIELEEEGPLDEEEDFDFEVSLFQSSSSTSQKREFKDPHLKWDLTDLAFEREEAVDGKEKSLQVFGAVDDTSQDEDDDACSVASDDYEFLFRPSSCAPMESKNGPQGYPPIMVIHSQSDAVLVRTRDIDDAISQALSDGKHATALRLGLRCKRDLRRHSIVDLINGYLGALLRLPKESPRDVPTAPSDLSVRRLQLAVKTLPILLGGDARRWEEWTSVFAEIPGALFVLKNRLPVRDPKLTPHTYQKVLETMLLEIERMEAEQDDYHQAKDHFLSALYAWGPLAALRDHIKCFAYTDRHMLVAQAESFHPHPRLDEAEASLLRRLHQSAVGFLELHEPSVNSTNVDAPIEATASLSDEYSGSLIGVDALLSSFLQRTKLGQLDGGTTEEVEAIGSHVALEALAELHWMKEQYDLALRYFLLIGCFHAVPELAILEDAAEAAVHRAGDAQLRGSTDRRNAHVLAMIDAHHVHGYLLKESFMRSESKDLHEDDETRQILEFLPPLVSLIRIVGLDLAGDFLVEHCVHAVGGTSRRYGDSTFPVNEIANQLTGYPKLLYWFLHLIFERKPEVYVKFPNTAIPPSEIRELHRTHLDLYVRFGGDAKDSAKFVAGQGRNLSDASTPLLRFLKSVLPLGSIRADEVKRVLEAHRLGKEDPSVVDTKEEVKFPHYFALEIAYVAEHYGSVNSEEEAKSILELYLKGTESVTLAAFYAERNTKHSSMLWGELLDRCLDRKARSTTDGANAGKIDGKLFGSLLEAAALSGADLSHLVSEIPQGMHIEGLRPRLVEAVSDYRLKLQMHQAASNILAQEKINLLRELGHRSRRGTRVHDVQETYKKNNEETEGSYHRRNATKDEHSDKPDLSNLAPNRPTQRLSRRRPSFALPVR